jgi:hypothetical protein
MTGCVAELLPLPPMPPDLRIVPPPPSVPRESARFSGRWVGTWEGELDHVLVVELEVQNDQTTEVIAVYSWGVSGALGVGSPGWTRARGRIEGGALRLELTRVQATAVYTMQADGTLVGEYWRGDRVTSCAADAGHAGGSVSARSRGRVGIAGVSGCQPWLLGGRDGR